MTRTYVLIAVLLLLVGLIHVTPAHSQYDPGIVFELQKRLIERGYHPGAADGVWGFRTASALRQFQMDNGLRATGHLDTPTVQALGLPPPPEGPPPPPPRPGPPPPPY